MTLAEVTYDLQTPLGPEQLRALATLANAYGVRRYRVNDALQQIFIEYDASRLQAIQVENILRAANIPVLRRA